MAKVIDEFQIGKYKVLKLDEAVPLKQHTKYVIGGNAFEAVPTYDAENCIAVESDKSFIGETVKFE